MRDRRLRVVGHRDHRVLGQKLLDPTGRGEDTGELEIGLGDRLDLRVGAVFVRVPVVVREREQQEVEQVVLDQVGRHAAGVTVAHAGHAESRAAAGSPGRKDVGVEELARAHHRMAHQGRGDAHQGGVALGLVAVAPAVHEVGGARRAHSASSRDSNTVGVSAQRWARFML